MEHTKYTIIWLIFLSILAISCNKEEIDIDAREAILGKWEIIENTFGPISYPGTYEEYKTDSLLFIYNSEDDSFHGKYWLNDSLLFHHIVWYTYDGVHHDTIEITQPFRYEFLSPDKLKLDSYNPALNPITIYKRIK
ncbi:MAG: hypothetical protein RIC06_11070 [Cyclobacteriaceae bacterium]